MAGGIAKQPNGRYCRYSSVVETITHFNMTKEDYLNNVTCTTRNREDALDTLDNHLQDYDYLISLITSLNTSKEEKRDLLERMSQPYYGRYEIN